MNTQKMAKNPFYAAMVAVALIVAATLSMARPSVAIPFPVNITVAPDPATVGGNPNDVLCADGTSTKFIKATVTAQDPTKQIPADTKVMFSTDKGSIPTAVALVNGVATTTFTAATTAGSATITASVTDSTGPKSNNTTVYMIGGAITGDDNVNYYCGTAWSPKGELTGASGQPTGTTYSWTITGPATLMDPNYPTMTWTEVSAKYAGTAGSNPSHRGDVIATLTYSLHGTNCSSTFHMTVLEPKTLLSEPTLSTAATVYGATDSERWGFNNQTVTYRIRDQYNDIMPSVSWNERWLNIHRPSGVTQVVRGTTDPFGAPASIGWGADAEGYIHDFHGAFGYDQVPALTASMLPVPIYSFDAHKFWVGSMSDGIGCLLLTHTNVQYATDGVTNDGP